MLGELSRDDDMEKSRPLLLICYAFGTSPALALWYFSFFSFSFYFPLFGRRGLLGFSPIVFFFFLFIELVGL